MPGNVNGLGYGLQVSFNGEYVILNSRRLCLDGNSWLGNLVFESKARPESCNAALEQLKKRNTIEARIPTEGRDYIRILKEGDTAHITHCAGKGYSSLLFVSYSMPYCQLQEILAPQKDLAGNAAINHFA